jgi:hypothetical protein
MKGIQFLFDDAGQRTAVLIDLKKNSALWEDFYDRSIAAERAGESRETFESVKKRIAKRRARRAHA